MNMMKLIKQYPSVIFFTLTFILSWSGILIVSIFTGMPANSKEFESIAPIAMFPLVIGPAIASIFLTYFIYGKKGLKKLWQQIIKWRINKQLYAFAIFTLPILASIILFILSRYSSEFLPKIITSENKTNLILSGLFVGVFLTLFEEIGWSGFAIPELRKRYSVLTTGFILGLLWGAWHFLPVYFGCGDVEGNLDFQLLYPGIFFHYGGLIPFRILLVWLYDKTKSILLPWIMHATLTSGTFFILNISKTGLPLFIYYLILSICLWIIVAIVNSLNKTRVIYEVTHETVNN
jgi:uncharacterized protein